MGLAAVHRVPPAEAEKRRGLAGMVYAFKIAGAKAEAGVPEEQKAPLDVAFGSKVTVQDGGQLRLDLGGKQT